jgi:CRISPR system Cascade subunit CasD
VSSSTLVLRLAGPMQSWGVTGQFVVRDTAAYPSKSGVIGLLAAAQGRQRGADISDLSALPFGVRIDQPGVLTKDYHTVSRLDGTPIPAASGVKTGANMTKVTTRYYLCDAVFLAAFCAESAQEKALLAELEQALTSPVYALSLGRRSCVPAGRVNLGVHDGDLLDVLGRTAWQASDSHRKSLRAKKTSIQLVIEDNLGADVLTDVPTNFAQLHRAFGSRRVDHSWIAAPTGEPTSTPTSDLEAIASHPGDHDPFDLIGW